MAALHLGRDVGSLDLRGTRDPDAARTKETRDPVGAHDHVGRRDLAVREPERLPVRPAQPVERGETGQHVEDDAESDGQRHDARVAHQVGQHLAVDEVVGDEDLFFGRHDVAHAGQVRVNERAGVFGLLDARRRLVLGDAPVAREPLDDHEPRLSTGEAELACVRGD